MKKIFLLLLTSLVLFSCKESSSDRHAMLPTSSGNINNLQVVIDNELWEGEVGEVLRRHFAATVEGLPQEEPLFSINQLPLHAFDGFPQRHRIFLYVKKGEQQQFRNTDDFYAKPQNGFFISGQTNEEIIEVIEENITQLIESFRKTEIKEKQRRMSLSRFNTASVRENLKVDFIMPSAYRIGKLTEDFVWLRKDIRSGDLNLLIYEMPLNYFEDESTRMQDIIRMRDSIGLAHIPGPVENSHMITEMAFTPYLFESEVDGKFAYLTKGTWEVYNFFMAGPFENYIIKDEKNNRYLVVEGFTFAPSVDKRDHQFELEAIIQSIRIQ
jgi:hypothetical protein